MDLRDHPTVKRRLVLQVHLLHGCVSGREGRVSMPVDDALTDDEKASGYILACQAEVKGNVELEA